MIGDVSLLVHPFFALFNLMEYKELSPDEKLRNHPKSAVF